MMTVYHLLTIWHVGAPRVRVWQALRDGANVGRWWRPVVGYRVLTPGIAGEGRRERWWLQRYWPWSWRVTTEILACREPGLCRYQVEGDLDGWGQLQLIEEAGGTRVLLSWHVVTTHRWIEIAGTMLRQRFSADYEAIMRQGQRGLSRWLRTTGRTDAVSAHLPERAV